RGKCGADHWQQRHFCCYNADGWRGALMELYIIRHGQSTNNALGTPVGRTFDPGLTDIGVRQADVLAAHLANGSCPESQYEQREGYHLDHVYCSAMQRALLTARPVGAALGLKPEVWVDIHEQGGLYLDGDGGEPVGYPGLMRGQIQADYPDYVLPDAVTEEGWWNRGFETVAGATGRAIAIADSLVERAKNGHERIALISHGMFVNLLLKALFNQLPTPTTYYHHYNTGITRLDIRQDGFIVLRYLNRTHHLTPDLITY
ncbi:MAG: histidine phosphatase family protein, partial [Anaerolineae bacterium]|nr:histidine phosphatase family protein [Anaerolineae bacterium]